MFLTHIKPCQVSLLFWVCIWATAQAQISENPYVYRIRVINCGTLGDLSLTGFQSDEYDGLVTALHGVVGCTPPTIIATNRFAPDGEMELTELEIVAVDYDRDIALLKSKAVEMPSGGLAAGKYVLNETKTLSAIGYPAGVSGQLLAAGSPNGSGALHNLYELIPESAEADAFERGSPNIDVAQAITIQDAITPGFSGAPIIDDSGQIVGIAQGLIPTSFIGWAIPWQDVNLVPLANNPDLNAKLEKLADPQRSALLMSSLIGSALVTSPSELPTDKTFNLRDENREHPYEFEEYERCETELYEPDSGHRFSGVFSVEIYSAEGADEPLVNVLSDGETLEAKYCIGSGPDMIGSRWEGYLDATIIAEQIPVAK